MSKREFGFEGRECDSAVRVKWRDLATAWLAAAAIGAALLLLPGLRGAGTEDRPPDPAPAATSIQDENLVPDGIGEVHGGIETCSVREYADERC
jgi:hypothetical protein